MNRSFWLVLLILGLLSVFTLSGILQVPFHPDESTQLYMSRDFELLFSHPSELFWNPDRANIEQHYRLIDAPLTRYWIGFIRQFGGLSSLPSDWNWSLTWEENQAAGALPSTGLVFSGRLAIALLLPLSLFLIYRAGAALDNRLLGVLAAILLGTNALVLVHDRRAMAEGMLTFGVCLSLWGIMHADRRPVLAAIGIALAFNAKQSALALFPAGLLAVLWLPEEMRTPKRLAANLFQYLLVFAGISLLLNTVWWQDPFHAIPASWQERREFLQGQVELTQELIPGQHLSTPGERAAIMIANLFIVDPQFAEVGNYLAQTQTASDAYLTQPANRLLRGFFTGGLMLVLAIYGMALISLRSRAAKAPARRRLVLFLVTFLLQAGALLVTVPLPHQRYVMPLVPFICLLASYPLARLVEQLVRLEKRMVRIAKASGEPT